MATAVRTSNSENDSTMSNLNQRIGGSFKTESHRQRDERDHTYLHVVSGVYTQYKFRKNRLYLIKIQVFKYKNSMCGIYLVKWLEK